MDKIKETIQNVLKVLLEGRLEDVKAKYDDNMSKIIDNLSEGDPSGNNKYLEWMAKVYLVNPNTNEILKVVGSYHENLQRLTSEFSTTIVDANKSEFPGRSEKRVKNNPKDISSYPTYVSLKLITDALEESKTERPDRDKIYQDDRWTIVVPKTHEAACKYGKHSNWCVSTSNEDYFNRYTKDNNALLFFILWRNKRNVNDKTEYKVAINAKFSELDNPEQWTWWDMPDKQMDPNLMLNIFPNNVIETIKKYLYDEGKKQNKIFDLNVLTKLINDNSVYNLGENDSYIYFTTNHLENFSHLPNYTQAIRYYDASAVNEKNMTIYVNKITAELRIQKPRQDIWNLDPSNSAPIESYKSWIQYYRGEKSFVEYLYSLPNGLTLPQEFKNMVETRVKELLSAIGGMWVDTRTTNLNIGDKVKWKKGRGYWNQRRSPWNESVIDRMTPSGFLVTGKTEEFPNGKRFKPSNNTTMDVWHGFSDVIDLSMRGQ